MVPNNEELLTIETMSRVRANLDRLMQSDDLRSARDTVAEDPLLLGSHVADWLAESAKRLRQTGNVQLAESVEFWLHVLRTFREFGTQDGYLELVVDELTRAKTAEEHRRILRENPGLDNDATLQFIVRRIAESLAVADSTAAAKYKMAGMNMRVKQFDEPEDLGVDITEVVNTFIRGFIFESDPSAQRWLLETRPDLMQPPVSVIVDSIFQPYVEGARAANDLVKLRALMARQALFARCQKVGLARAFQELAAG
jgi:hypothetical protein